MPVADISSKHNLTESLFWVPASLDLLLLAFTYSSCITNGSSWYLDLMEAQEEQSINNKKSVAVDHKKDDGDRDGNKEKNTIKKNDHQVSSLAQSRIDKVWELAMMAYSAYAATFPVAFYWAGFKDKKLRGPFCAGMSVLMLLKVLSLRSSPSGKTQMNMSKLISLLGFNLPTYGGYTALWIWKMMQ